MQGRIKTTLKESRHLSLRHRLEPVKKRFGRSFRFCSYHHRRPTPNVFFALIVAANFLWPAKAHSASISVLTLSLQILSKDLTPNINSISCNMIRWRRMIMYRIRWTYFPVIIQNKFRCAFASSRLWAF